LKVTGQFAPKRDRFCSFDGLFAEERLLTKSEAALNRAYRGTEKLLGRIRYFTDGAVIGSKEFLIKAYATFAGTAILKKDRNLYPTGITPTYLKASRPRSSSSLHIPISPSPKP